MMIKTPHINADSNDFAKTVLMPGDPLRSKYIAENFLENAKLVNDIRGVQGYTGLYKGHKVSVMASGMGMPSIGIYSKELFVDFDVDNIIRIGSAGSIKEDLQVRDLLIANGAYTDTNYDNMLKKGINKTNASNELVEKASEVAKDLNYKYVIGNLFSSDTYYSDEETNFYDAKAVEMEAAALFQNANKYNKKALALVTISNSILTGEELPAIERQNSFNEMITVALELAVRMDEDV